MMKKYLKNGLKFISMFLCVLFLAGFFAGCSSSTETKTYAIAGLIVDENNMPVEGVVVDGGEYGTATTDNEGKFSFANIKSGLIIAPSKEGYHFEVKSKAITSADSDANFVASKEYTVTGKIANNGSGIGGEVLYFTSLANPASENCVVTSDEEGNFTITGVAGKTYVSYVFNGAEIIDEATINETNVNIELTSSIRLSFEFDDGGQSADEVVVNIGGTNYSLDSDFEIEKSNLKFNDVVEISSPDYEFEVVRFNLEKQYESKTIKAYKKYNVSGTISSGDIELYGADIYVDGVFKTSTDEFGNYEIQNLTKQKNISVFYNGLNFDEKQVSFSSNTANFNGTKNVKLTTKFDYNGLEELSFDTAFATSTNKIDYVIHNVNLGEVVEFSSDVYHLNETSFVVGSSDIYFVTGDVIYTAEVSGLEEGFALLLDGECVQLEQLAGLYGKHTLTASFENYIFSSYEIAPTNSVVTLSYKIPYSVVLSVVSGELKLEGARVEVQGQTLFADADGKVEISNLIDEPKAIVSLANYNNANLNLSSDTPTVTANLSYDISGYAKTGDISVAFASVSVAGKSAQTNTAGYFEVKELFGSNTLFVTKENNAFESVSVTKGAEVLIQGTYTIFGTLKNDNGFIAGKTITLEPNVDGMEPITTVSDEDGYYEFSSLTLKYTLTSADFSSTDLLRPYSYIVTSGGEYNFSSTGYAISGTVKSGGVGIEGVVVKAGSAITYTDSNGGYAFELLTGDCEVSATKEGYVFSAKQTVSDASDSINFTATYSVSGLVKSGLAVVEGATLVLNQNSTEIKTNENGEFVISGLEGENNIITFEKENMIFSSSSVSIAKAIVIDANVQVSITAKTGSLLISNFDYCINGDEPQTETTSEVQLALKYGDVVTVSKNGYSFESVTITFDNSYEINATYSVSGAVLSDDVVLEGVAVVVNGTTVLTDMSGKFLIENLSGENTISFEKSGITFESKTVNGYKNNLNIQGTFEVSGEVKVLGLSSLSGVDVYFKSSKIATTDAEGRFTATGLSGYYTLSFIKEGYTIPAVENKFGSQTFSVIANYSVSGLVKSGDIVLSNAKVDLYLEGSGIPVSVTTDETGSYSFTNIEKTATIVVSKSGYDTVTSEPVTNLTKLDFSLTYSVTLSFTGGVTGVSIYVNDVLQTAYSSTHKITGLSGKTTIKLQKVNTDFLTYNEFEVEKPGTYEISSRVSYDVTGYVKSQTSNLPVSGITMQAGSKTTVTDANGYFEFKGAAGTLQIKQNGIESNKPTIDHDGDYSSYFTLTESEFAILLVSRGYAKLDSAKSVQIYANGLVSTNMENIAGPQYVASVYKRDTKGNILKQNLNSGSATAGIDPNVALLVYKKMPEVQGADPYYGYIKHQNVSTEGTTIVNIYAKDSSTLSATTVNVPTASYDANFTTSSASAIKSIFGSLPEEYSSASIVGSTCQLVSFDGTNYTFMLALNLSQPNYKSQIQALSPGSTHDNFSKINHYYKINKDGWIVSLNTDEKYQITQNDVPILGTQSVIVNSDILYTFYTTNENTIIDDIVATSEQTIKTSLAISNQTIAESEPAKLTSFDIVKKTIFG